MPLDDRHALVIVGGGPAAMAAARAYRLARPDGRIAMIADEGRVPYRRPPLSKELLRRETTDLDLPLEGDDWPAHNRMDLVAGRAVGLDPQERRITLAGGRTLDYERCVLAPGAEPARLAVRGADDPAVRVLRSRDDLWAIERRLTHDTRVAVVGSGFIGCEVAASLRVRGLAVTLFTDERAPQEARLGAGVADRIASWLRADGVQLRVGAAIARIEREDGVLRLHTGAGRPPGVADVVIMATGAVPRTELATAAGIDCSGGAIPVDDRLRTVLPDVWAAGDACLAHNALAGRALRVEHWGDALTQGEIAGRGAAGDPHARWDAVPGFWSTIGHRTLKHAAWGDGYADAEVLPHRDGAFTVRYRDAGGRLVGVLTHDCDLDYDDGRDEIAAAASTRLPTRVNG